MPVYDDQLEKQENGVRPQTGGDKEQAPSGEEEGIRKLEGGSDGNSSQPAPGGATDSGTASDSSKPGGAPEPGEDDDSETGGLYKKSAKLKAAGKGRKKGFLIAGAGAGVGLVFLAILLILMLSSLKVVHFGEVMATAGYARFNGIMNERMTQNIFDAAITDGDGSVTPKGRSLVDRFKFRNVDLELAKYGREGRFSVQLENGEFKSTTIGQKTISLDEIAQEKFNKSYAEISEGRLNKVGAWRERMTVRNEFVKQLQANVGEEFASEAKYIRSGIFDVISKNIGFKFSGWRQKGREYFGKTAVEARTENLVESAEKTQGDEIPTGVSEIDNLTKQQRSKAKLQAFLEKNGGVFDEAKWETSLAADAANATKVQEIATKAGTGILVLSLACMANQAFAHAGEIADSNEQQAALTGLEVLAKSSQTKSGQINATAVGAQADRYNGGEQSSYYAWATQQDTIPDDGFGQVKLKSDDHSDIIALVTALTSPSTWTGYNFTFGLIPGLPSGDELDAKVCSGILSPEGAVIGVSAELIATGVVAVLTGGGGAAYEQGGTRILAEQFVGELFQAFKGVFTAKTAATIAGVGIYGAGLHVVSQQLAGNAISTPESGVGYVDTAGVGMSVEQEKQTRSLYGRPLTAEESKQADQRYLAMAKDSWSEKSLATRYFDINNPFSMIGSVAAIAPTGASNTVQGVLSLFTHMGSTLTGNFGKLFMGNNIASAASDYNPYGDSIQSGYSLEELNKMRNDPTYSLSQNSDYITDTRLAELDSSIGKCFDPLRTQREIEGDADCTASNLSTDEVLRYRISKLDDTLWKVLTDPIIETNSSTTTNPNAPTTNMPANNLGCSGYTKMPGNQVVAYDTATADGCNKVKTLCASGATAQQKLVCGAAQYAGVYYANDNKGSTYNQAGGRGQQLYGMVTKGNYGHPPSSWVTQRTDPAYNFIDCSGIVNVAVYTAYGVDESRCSAGYLSSPLFTRLPDLSSLQPGDILIENETCGNDGHIGIVASVESDGSVITFEASAGGYPTRFINRKQTDSKFLFRYAMRYKGE